MQNEYDFLKGGGEMGQRMRDFDWGNTPVGTPDRWPMSLRAMGEMLVCDSGASPSRLVERLVSAGLVERAIDAGDRRQVLLSLTREGTDRARDVLEIEERLYDLIDAALQSAGSDTAPDAGARTDAILSFLRSFTRGSSAGTAYARRFASRSGR